MRIDIITIFPEYFDSPLRVGLLGKAIEKGLINIKIHNLRDFAKDKHRTVDDEPFGGGEGMVFKPEPLAEAVETIKKENPESLVIYTSPKGELFSQELAERLSREKGLIFICGRYEGIDERIVKNWVDLEISIGDYVVFGGEVASLVMIEAISRLIPGVVGCEDSVKKESFSSGLLKYSCYTRPREFKGLKVPEVLLSGNHKEIEIYRKKEAFELTLKKRPYLLKKKGLSREDRKIVNEILQKQRVYIFLLHYPVYNKRGEVVCSAIANIDLHDLARVSRTYGVKGVYIVQPMDSQREVAKELLEYWMKGRGKEYNPLRREALELVELFPSFEEALERVREREKEEPVKITTDASLKSEKLIDIEKARRFLWEKPVVLIFGTAWGLCEEVFERCDYFLEPIWGRLDEYNHLSVRSACSIYLDRILGVYSFYKKN